MIKAIFFAVIFLIIFLIARWYIMKFCKAEAWLMSCGEKEDKVDVLLSKIVWANHYKAKNKIILVHIFTSMIISLIVLLVLCENLPSPSDYIRTVFIMFIFLQAFYNFHQFHCEKFPHYFIGRNVGILRKKLNVKKANISPSKRFFDPASECMNFRY